MLSTGCDKKMIHDCHINLKPNKSAKQQYLDVIRMLIKKLNVPIDVALLSVNIIATQKQIKSIKRELLSYCENIFLRGAAKARFKDGGDFRTGKL